MANSALAANPALYDGSVTVAKLAATVKQLLHGQCRFEYVSSSVCRLSRFNGRWLLIDGEPQEIPSAGVDIAPAALASNDTTYYVYAYMSSGTMTLEASATAPAADSTTGVRIKTGDSTRTLVGQIRKTSSVFVFSAAVQYVTSYFNRRQRVAFYSGSAAAFTSGSFASYDGATAHCYILTWADETVAVTAHLSGYQNSGSPAYFGLVIAIDGTGVTAGNYANPMDSGSSSNVTTSIHYGAALADGMHYFAAFSAVNTGQVAFQAGSGILVTYRG